MTIYQKLKIVKFILYLFQNIVQLFGPKNEKDFFEEGGGIRISLTRKNPDAQCSKMNAK